MHDGMNVTVENGSESVSGSNLLLSYPEEANCQAGFPIPPDPIITLSAEQSKTARAVQAHSESHPNTGVVRRQDLRTSFKICRRNSYTDPRTSGSQHAPCQLCLRWVVRTRVIRTGFLKTLCNQLLDVFRAGRPGHLRGGVPAA